MFPLLFCWHCRRHPLHIIKCEQVSLITSALALKQILHYYSPSLPSPPYPCPFSIDFFFSTVLSIDVLGGGQCGLAQEASFWLNPPHFPQR